MGGFPFSRLLPFLVTFALIAAVGAFKVFLNHTIAIESPILLFFGAISFAAWFGGFKQGLFAIMLSLLFMNIYLNSSLTTDEPVTWLIRQGLFVADSIVIAWVCSRMRRETLRSERAQTALRMNAQRLERIFSSDMVGIAFSTPEGLITDANDYFLNTLGASRKELYAGELTWQKHTPEEFRAISEEAVDKVLRTGHCETFEKEYVRPDGTRVICLVSSRRVDENTLVAFVQDITKAKKTQVARLTQSQTFLDSVIENIPNMIFVKDAKDLRFVRFNKAGERMIGHLRENLIGRNDYDLFPKEQADAFTLADRDVLSAGQAIDIPEEPLSTPTGERLLHTKKIPVMGPDGQPQYLLGISEDITEKRRTELQRIELLHSEFARLEAEKSASRLKFLADASVALNQSLDVRMMMQGFANVVVRELAGACIIDLPDDKRLEFERLVIARDERNHQGRIIADFVKCPILNDEQEGPSACLRTGQARIYRDKSSEILHNLIKGCPLVLDEIQRLGTHSMICIPLTYHGRPLGVMTLLSPSAEHQYDELDLSVAQDLARRAALALENAFLYNRAFEASRTKSAFLANISHEIRTPLGAMIGFAELSLEDQNLAEKQREFISKIAKNGQQLLRIVNDVLDLSKVESDRLQIEKVKFNLPRLLEEIVSLLSIQADVKGLKLSLKKSEDLPQEILTDPLRLRQILINIIGNAIKFTGSGEVCVRTQYQADGGNNFKNRGRLSLWIQDTGVGIEPEQAKRLFEPFVQIDETMARRFGGTGLGLFLSRKLARLLNGDVILESSDPRKGSCFRVSIDIETADEAPTPFSSSDSINTLDTENGPASKISSPQSSKLHGKLLVVEDSIDNQILIQAFLDQSGLDIEMAENGRIGVEKALAQPHDLVLMDIQMPEMDGFEAIRLLRQKNYKGRVVALTAHGMKGDRERCLKEGFDDFLVKPISRQSLSECVMRNLEESHLSPRV